MPMHLSFYTAILFCSSAFSFLVATALFTKYQKNGKYASILIMLTGWWCAGSAFCLMQTDLAVMFTIVRFKYLAIALFPAFWVLFVLNYLRAENMLSANWRRAIFVVPVITLLLVLTNTFHHLYYASIDIYRQQHLSLFKFTKGPWYLVHTIYFYCCLIVGILLLILKSDWKNYFLSRKTATILIAAIVPACCNMLYLAGFGPMHGIDLTPFAFSVTTLLIALSLFKYNLFDVVPIAREKVIEALSEGVLVLDEKDRIVFLNPAMQLVLAGKQTREGAPISSILPELHLEDGTSGEIEFTEENDARRTFAVTANQFVRGSRKSGRILLFKDISERKQTELLLLQAKEEAEQASRAKTDFLSTMSHEIRTPMNAVIGFTGLLLQNAREDQKEYLNLLKYSGENLLALINDILDFSKINAGKIELEAVDFNIGELLKKVQQTLDYKADEKGVKLNLYFDENVPAVLKGDPVRLGQILINLVSNAIKFTEQGNVDIRVKLISQEQDTSRIFFEVRDTGIGIPMQKQQTIFDSFTQASSDTTRKFGGTGLGLAICKNLVELHGGTIGLSSQPGEGSTFCFEIEFKHGAVKNLSPESSIPSAPASLEGLKVLLAEDNKVNVLLAKQVLKQWHINCDVAQNGLIALEMTQANDYDIILMDLQMPEMDGYSATEAIRALPGDKFKSLPIIALSAAAFTEEKEKVYQYGMNDFITKPFQPQELFEKLNFYKPAAARSEIDVV